MIPAVWVMVPLLALRVTLSALAFRFAASEMLPADDVREMSPSPPTAVPAVIGALTVSPVPAVTTTFPPVTPEPEIVRLSLSV